MRTFAFVSDFDGTLTSRDFYQIIIEKYLKERGKALYTEWKKAKKINVEFLNIIFASIDLSLGELKEEILKIPLDAAAVDFIREVRRNGGEFFIVSAGTSYYIDILLKHLGIDVKVISMQGIYQDRGIRIIPDAKSPYYSEVFGLDKRKVIEDIRKNYDVVFFAGDSEPDLAAAKEADYAFAKNELRKMMEEVKHDYIKYTDYTDIRLWMESEGWLRGYK